MAASRSKHEEKMLNLQVQLRQNQTELQDYLSELDNWETDIKKKEAKLKTGSQGKKDSTDLPPVRNTIHKKKLKKKRKEKPVDPSKPKRISGYDFQAWDKFDVDKALEEADKDEKKETSSSEYETDEEWEMERKKHLAGLEKDKGNVFLKQGDYDQAVEAYTKGIEFDSTNAILPANRAMALLKQQKFAAAEFDCTTSITLDPLYVKAYLRRATSRSGMGKLKEAVADFNRVLDLEPTNKQAKTEIERLEKEVHRDKEAPVATTLTEDERGRVKPIYKPPEDRSKKPLIRIPIEEIGLETRSRPEPSAEQSEMAKQIVDKEKQEFDKLFSGKPPKMSHDLGSGDATQKAEAKSQETKLNNNKESTPESSTTIVKELSSKRHVESTCSEKKQSALDKRPTLANGHSGKALTKPTEPREVLPSNKSFDGEAFSVPQTSFQFQTDFKTLKTKPQSFLKYFQAIPRKSYPKLFGQSFDSDILVTILRSLEAITDGTNLFDILTGLAEVKRFSMAAMFLSKKDKAMARGIMDKVKDAGTCSEQDLAVLLKKYDL